MVFEIVGTVERDPGLSLILFPNQKLEGQVDGDGGGGEHEGACSLGAAENQQLGGTHFHADFFRFSPGIDERVQVDSLGLEKVLDFLNGLIEVDDAFDSDLGHDVLLSDLAMNG